MNLSSRIHKKSEHTHTHTIIMIQKYHQKELQKIRKKNGEEAKKPNEIENGYSEDKLKPKALYNYA